MNKLRIILLSKPLHCIIDSGPTRGDVPDIGIISPIPGDQGNVLRELEEASVAENNVKMIRNEFTEIGGGVNAMRINNNGGQFDGPGPAVNFGPDPLVDLGLNSGFDSGANMAADLRMSQSNFGAGNQLVGGGNGFDHIDSININIDPSLGLDFGPQTEPLIGPAGFDSQFNSKDGIFQAEIDNSLGFNDKNAANFAAMSNVVEPAPISLADANFDSTSVSSSTSKKGSSMTGIRDDHRIIRRTTTVKKTIRTPI